ncbi:MAG: hypothetical protein ACOVLE_11025, partial [Pirellula staleyi]
KDPSLHRGYELRFGDEPHLEAKNAYQQIAIRFEAAHCLPAQGISTDSQTIQFTSQITGRAAMDFYF